MEGETEVYNATLRIPTAEQYAYIEIEMQGTADQITNAYGLFTRLSKAGTGLVDADFRKALDRYIWDDGKMDANTYLAMNEEQQNIIQTIKRSKKRNAYPTRELQDRISIKEA